MYVWSFKVVTAPVLPHTQVGRKSGSEESYRKGELAGGGWVGVGVGGMGCGGGWKGGSVGLWSMLEYSISSKGPHL